MGEDDELRVGNSKQDNIKKLLQSFCKHLWAEVFAREYRSRLQKPRQTQIVSTLVDFIN